jgi:hypothetical protein
LATAWAIPFIIGDPWRTLFITVDASHEELTPLTVWTQLEPDDVGFPLTEELEELDTRETLYL